MGMKYKTAWAGTVQGGDGRSNSMPSLPTHLRCSKLPKHHLCPAMESPIVDRQAKARSVPQPDEIMAYKALSSLGVMGWKRAFLGGPSRCQRKTDYDLQKDWPTSSATQQVRPKSKEQDTSKHIHVAMPNTEMEPHNWQCLAFACLGRSGGSLQYLILYYHAESHFLCDPHPK